MKGKNLGELEELVLLMVGALGDEAYGVAIMDEIEAQVRRRLNISAIHSVLKRLEKKGFLTSEMGGSTNERGGRRKRLFVITNGGKVVLEEIREVRNLLWEQIPKLAYSALYVQ
jgi:PadR family transcriptional regulator PadR